MMYEFLSEEGDLGVFAAIDVLSLKCKLCPIKLLFCNLSLA